MKQREIKFRAWDKDKNVFIPTDVWAIITNDFMALGVMTKDWENYKEGEYLYDNSQSVMQFTGLLDKNGNEIYEGDIVSAKWETSSRGGYIQSSDAYVEHEIKCRVIWYYMGFAYERKDGKMTNIPSSASIEVIGNIYENPEIL